MSNDAARGDEAAGSGLASHSAVTELMSGSPDAPPTRVRYGVAGVLTVMACLLYLDRFAVGIASEYIREDLRMTQTQMSWFLSAFFWSYALSQVPAGWLSDRFGQRLMLTVYILTWSAFTGLLGLAASVWLVLHLRLYCGIAQAGAFPVCSGLIRNWFPISQRGTASSIVALGGRAGGVLAPILTAWLIVYTSGLRQSSVDFKADDVIDVDRFLTRMCIVPVYTELSEKIVSCVEPQFDGLDRWGWRWRAIRREMLIAKGDEGYRRAYETWLADLERGNSGDSVLKSLNIGIDWSEGERDKEDRLHIAAGLSECLNDIYLADRSVIRKLKLSPKAKRLAQKIEEGAPLSQDQIRMLNRSILEAAFPRDLAKLDGRGWRPTLIVYGLVGLVVAFAFAWVGRNTPRQHPWCNEAERRFIDDEASLAAKAVEPRDAPFPCRAIVTSLSLWGNSLMQFFTNIGWLFVVTWLPRYLDKVHGVPLAEQALMTAVPTAAGIVGMLFGGRWTDLAARKLGLKWGRRLPIASTRLLSAFGYGICLTLGILCTPDPTTRWLPWAMIAGLSVMVMGVDLGVPATWAYAQDVGGKYTGAILGWANMWGNIGAAVAPLIYNAVLGETPSLTQWNTMFAVCAVAFILSGLCGLVLDATKPIMQEGA